MRPPASGKFVSATNSTTTCHGVDRNDLEALNGLCLEWRVDSRSSASSGTSTSTTSRARCAVRGAPAPPRPHARRLLAPPRAHRVAVPSRAAQNYWVRPAFGFNIQEVIDLFDSWGWVVNVFDGLEEDDDMPPPHDA